MRNSLGDTPLEIATANGDGEVTAFLEPITANAQPPQVQVAEQTKERVHREYEERTIKALREVEEAGDFLKVL